MFASDEDAWDGAVFATKNARTLYESANQVHESGAVGCATALLVLSAEESSKALGVGLHICNPIPQENLQSLFRNHAFKHNQGAYASSIMHLLLGLTHEPAEGKPRHGECGVLDHIEAWKLEADSLKKRGFYVDYSNGEWQSPDSMTEDEYKQSVFIAGTLLAMAEGFFLKGSFDEIKSHRS